MSRPKLINQLKQKNPQLSRSEISIVIEIFCTEIEKSLINNTNIELRGFGSFFLKKTKEKFSARNPKTGELIYVPRKNKVRFKASKKLNNFVNE